MSLLEHLSSLLSSDFASSIAHQDEWSAVVKEWEESRQTNGVPHALELDDRDQAILTQASPWPALLDYYSQPPKPGQSSRSPKGGPPSPPTLSRQVPRHNVDVPKLKGRLQRQLPAPSQYLSLTTLLSSDRSNDDIQSELVEVLGFEGDGLALVEELLRPGIRDAFLEDLHGGTGNSGRGAPSHTVYARQGFKQKKKDKRINVTDIIGTNEDIERRLQEQLEGPKAMFVEEERWIPEQEQLPHVFTSTSNIPGIAISQGGKFALPSGTERELSDTFEEVIIPPSRPIPPRATEKPVKIADLSPLAKGCFPKYVALNRMQSVVQPIAMNTNENMLVCAPTGAGKTDVAIMAIIRVLALHLKPGVSTHPSGFSIDRDAFKIIYVAPMKALAAEITRKFGKRLAWLGIKVRELTGDMQLTRQEIAGTQIIVTTPEKWDVVTRKPTGEGELASKVKLLIIDEVHLLNEERGAVIETIVARTLRQVESSQSLIRIVGLSATLPNYIDVSDFLRVNRYQGLFFFDASFRPVPLEQHFIGVSGKPRSQQSIRNMEQVVFDKVAELVQRGHQVMVFVHARKETVNTAKKLKEQAVEEGMTTFFEATDHPKHGIYRRDIGTSRNKEMKELFDAGFGIHHAGMLRSDRNMMERMFEDNAIKVLCCTSTLAWGVNLPAHAVVIKGTQVYDSSRGAFVDLSVLDVLQIFGRAGRPGYETSGVGYICTTHDKLDHYLQSIMSQHPIESKFIPGMIDSLNAEIALGTITSVQDAIQWLGYTYLFVRMRREPFIYGMAHDELKDDPQLGNKRNELITQAALQLGNAKMARYDDHAHAFVISDLGRIAAKYYLKYQTIDVFNERFHAKMRNADLFDMLSQATEFDQIQLRETEMPELTGIMESEEYCPLEVKGGVSTKQGKVNILLQAHISRVFLEDFALVSDSAYVAQNAARIIRALLEIALSRNWANNALLLIDLSKAIEQRMWPYDHPLQQVSTLQKDTLYNLRRHADDVEIPVLRDMEAKELGDMIHMNETHGQAVKTAAQSLPMIEVAYALRPLSHDVIEIRVKITPTFSWNAKVSTSAEPFYIWVQEEKGIDILQWRSVLLRQTTTSVELDFVLTFEEELPTTLTIVSASDRWLGSGEDRVISLEGIKMPEIAPPHTQVLDVPFLNIRCLDDPALQQIYNRYITTLNNIQTQAFWTIYHTSMNVLVSAPVASGKSFLGEMAIWHAFRHNPHATVLVLCPSKAAARETAARMQSVMPKTRPVKVHSLFSPSDFERTTSGTATIAVTCPSSLLSLEAGFAISLFRHLALGIFEDLHLLDTEYELAIARLLSIAKPNRARLVGLTCSLSDPSDLATWLGVEDVCRFHFLPTDRGHPIITSVRPFSLPHSATLMKVMVKPTYDILKTCQAGAIVFVPSRAACRTVATDLVTQSGNAMDINGFLKIPRADVEPLLQRVRDDGLYEPLLHGIGYITANMAPSDMALVLELFASGIVRALIAPREACWTLPVKGETVVVMGAQHVQMHDGERRVVNYSRTELVMMQSFAITSALPLYATSQGSRMFVLCQNEQREPISRALTKGLPLESSIPDLIKKQSTPIATAALTRMTKSRPPPPKPQLHRPRATDYRKRDLMDMLRWTYFSLRVQSNPTYYDIHPGHEEEGVSRLVDEWFVGDEYGPPSGFDKINPTAHTAAPSAGGAVIDIGTEVVNRDKVGEKDGETADQPAAIHPL